LLGDDPGDRTTELAYHWAQAVHTADTSKAVHYAQLAGDRALSQLAPDQALHWYGQALALLGRAPHTDDPQRAELLVGLGEAQRQTGIATSRETLLEAARLADQIDDIDVLVRAVLANSRGFASSTGEADADRIAAIDRALERIGTEPSVARAKLLALAASERTFLVELDERLALAEQGVAVARASADRPALAWALQRPFASITHPSTLALRSAQMHELCAIADELTDPTTQFHAHLSAWITALERGDAAAIDDHLHRGEEIAARTPHATIRWTLAFHQAWRSGLRGDLTDYERLAEAALAFGTENGEPDAFTIYASQLTNLRDHQGRLYELIPLIEQALADTPKLNAFRGSLALAQARAGHIDKARAMIRQELTTGFPMPDDMAWSTGIANWADAAVLTHERDAAALLREELAPYHDQIVTTTITIEPAVSHYLGTLDHVLGRNDDANNWFAEAMQLHQQLESPLLIAYTHAAWAALLADRNQGDDPTRAGAMAGTALATATALGYAYIETDARAVLDRLS
jgi:tetratricopeptide (TPR) repeat protein